MNHLSTELLNLYLDDALESAEKVGVEGHLKTCPVCQQELAAIQAVFVTLSEWQLETPPYDISRVVMAQLEPIPVISNRWLSLAILTAQIMVCGLLGFWVVPWLVNLFIDNSPNIDFSGAGQLFSRLIDWFAGLPGIIPAPGNLNLPLTNLGFNPLLWLLIAGGLGIVWLVGNRLLLAGLTQSNPNSQEVSR